VTTTDHPIPQPAGDEDATSDRSAAADSPLAPGTPEYIDDPGHFGIEHGQPWPEDVPRGQNDTHWRYEDDPKGARRAELRVAACWSLMFISGIGLAFCYVLGGQTQN
jgi:hypothetical protein